MIALAPFLNKGIERCKDKELLLLTLIWGCTVSVFPTFFPVFPWSQDDSNIGEFILLYLIVGCIKRIKKRPRTIVWLLIWAVCAAGLTGSAIVLHRFVPAHETFFYRYNSAVVIVEALAVFMSFLSLEIKNARIQEATLWIQGSSLIVYELHMHPLFKEKYTEWKIFNYVSTDSFGVYIMQILLTVFGIFIIGTLFGKPVCYVSEKICRWAKCTRKK